MPDEPLITTVIPTYRRPELLRRAIRSVLDQTYPHFQVCVYDNASGDGTAEVVNALARRDSRVRYHCHPENIGSQENFRFGVSRVDTPFFNLLSDDDFLLPDFFARAIYALRNNPKAAFFSGGLLQADDAGHVVGFPCYGSEGQQTYWPPQLFHLLAPYTRTWTSALFRRTMLDSLGGLKKEIAYSFPVDFVLRSATRYPAVLSDIPCAVFTVHPASISTAESLKILESLLDLSLFDSINQAIDRARDDKIISPSDAATMKATYRALTEQNFVRSSFSLIARGDVSVAARTAELLSRVFERQRMAVIIRIATINNGIGAFLRFATKSTIAARRSWLARNNSARYSTYSDLVRSRLQQLSGFPV
jgi:glycosyltransferase involved in cell wall biosynthesis